MVNFNLIYIAIKNFAEELCYPSPCGQNTKCEVINDVPVCTCLPGYFGSPSSGCRHECDSDYDCSPSQMCQQYKCTSACAAGTCAPTAICDVNNHRPTCSCPKVRPLHYSNFLVNNHFYFYFFNF